MNDNLLSKWVVAAMVGALFLVAGTANAIDLRSWDRKINDVSQRFVVLPAFQNEAVLDKETQLVWQRRPGTYKVNWIGAYASCLSIYIGGRSGWRLPTADELTSLQVRLASGAYTLPSGHPFQDIQNWVYWSATVHPDPAVDQAFAMGPFSAPASPHLLSYQKSQQGHVWCVRGGR